MPTLMPKFLLYSSLYFTHRCVYTCTVHTDCDCTIVFPLWPIGASHPSRGHHTNTTRTPHTHTHTDTTQSQMLSLGSRTKKLGTQQTEQNKINKQTKAHTKPHVGVAPHHKNWCEEGTNYMDIFISNTFSYSNIYISLLLHALFGIFPGPNPHPSRTNGKRWLRLIGLLAYQ